MKHLHMKFPKLLYPSFLCLLMAGCDMIDYHPYDVHISGETDVNAHNIAQIEQNCQNKTKLFHGISSCFSFFRASMAQDGANSLEMSARRKS